MLLLFTRYRYGKDGLFMRDFAFVIFLFLVDVALYRLLIFQSLSLNQRDAMYQILLPSFALVYFQVGKNRLTSGRWIAAVSGGLIVLFAVMRI